MKVCVCKIIAIYAFKELSNHRIMTRRDLLQCIVIHGPATHLSFWFHFHSKTFPNADELIHT